MAQGPRLDLRQSQSLVMTPQLQQAIRLLALSNLEVEAFIAEELEKNPLLEAVSAESEGRDGEEAPIAREEQEPSGADALMAGAEGAGDTLDVDLGSETFHHDSVADGGPQDYGAGEGAGVGTSSSTGAGGDEDFDFDRFEAEAPSLHDHLKRQAGLVFDGGTLLIANQLIDLIDEAGYLSVSLLDLANRLGVPLVQVESVLSGVQSFDPTGVAARSLSECIALQAQEADRYDPAMARLIDNLELLAQGRLAQLKRMCDVDDEDMSDMIKELRGYDPKPGLKFGFERSHAVTPDIYIAQRGSGWSVEINSASLPRLLINRSYHAELTRDGTQDRASKLWLSECLASANWLVKAMDQRQRTIIKVATEILKHQDAFFRKGVAHLRPLTLRQVAEAVGLHESTISRVTSNKYLSCARGMFELKYFFTSGISASDGGEAVSAEAVKNAIRLLINAETADAILSDDSLVELLKAQGFDIARRTVAKYREAQGLGSSVQRRRAMVLAG